MTPIPPGTTCPRPPLTHVFPGPQVPAPWRFAAGWILRHRNHRGANSPLACIVVYCPERPQEPTVPRFQRAVQYRPAGLRPAARDGPVFHHRNHVGLPWSPEPRPAERQPAQISTPQVGPVVVRLCRAFPRVHVARRRLVRHGAFSLSQICRRRPNQESLSPDESSVHAQRSRNVDPEQYESYS